MKTLLHRRLSDLSESGKATKFQACVLEIFNKNPNLSVAAQEQITRTLTEGHNVAYSAGALLGLFIVHRGINDTLTGSVSIKDWKDLCLLVYPADMWGTKDAE